MAQAPAALRNEETIPAEAGAADLLAGADAGMALFDQDLRLIACNAMYGTLCGYEEAELVPGQPLSELIRLTLTRSKTGNVDATVRQAVQRLSPGKVVRLKHERLDGHSIEITRNRLPNGSLVETVRPADDASAHYLATLRLAEAMREQLSQSLDAMGDGLALWSPDDRLVLYNQNYVDLNPHIADAIHPGACFEALLRLGIDRGGFAGEDREETFASFLERHRNPGGTFELQLSDGRWVQVREDRTPDGGIIGTRTDVTELKRRELELQRLMDELHEKSSMFNTALNNMIQGLCMFDSEQTLIVCNQRYLEMYGFSSEVVKPGIKLREIMEYSISIGNYTREDADRALAERPTQAGEATRSTIKQYLRDGRIIAVMNEPMKDGGSIATYQDVTDLERSQEKLVEYNRKLERSNRELQDFAYVASHDLQEPLRKIEAFGDRLAKKYLDTLPDDGKLYLEKMQNAAGRMRQLISDLLSYSRVTTKANPFSPTDLNVVAEGVLSDLQMRIEDTKGRVELAQLPTIDADPTQMRQLLQNLIANALKFRKPDVDPVVKVECRDVEGPNGETFCELTIADNGIGFEDQYKEQIFTIFQRLHGRMEYEGTGVGLATTRKIVERHGGMIDAHGVPDVGATFTVRLPKHQAVAGEVTK